jgi:hypothetical protein
LIDAPRLDTEISTQLLLGYSLVVLQGIARDTPEFVSGNPQATCEQSNSRSKERTKRSSVSIQELPKGFDQLPMSTNTSAVRRLPQRDQKQRPT